MEARSTRHESPCGDGKMVWHMWDASGGRAPVVVLFHGGAGSWRHWVRTIPVLEPTYRVLAPDLPGLGESDFPPDGDNAKEIAKIVVQGIDAVIGADSAPAAKPDGRHVAAAVAAATNSRPATTMT